MHPPSPSTADRLALGFADATHLFLSLFWAGFALLLTIIGYGYEVMAYDHLLGADGTKQMVHWLPLTMAEAMALGFGGAKIAAVFILVARANEGKLSVTVVGVRVMLIVLSLFATLMIVSLNSVSPNTSRVVAELRKEAIAGFDAHLETLDTRHRTEMSRLITAQSSAEQVVAGRHNANTADFKRQLEEERVTGIGARFLKLEQMIIAEDERFRTELSAIRASFGADIKAELASHDTAQSAIFSDRETALSSITDDAVAGTQDAQNLALVRTAQVLTRISPEGVGPVDTMLLTIFFTFLIALCVELVPLMIFRQTFGALIPKRASLVLPKDRVADGQFQATLKSDPPTVHSLREAA